MIGSGLGGIAAAVLIGASGHHFTVLEKLEAPGSRARRRAGPSLGGAASD